MKRRRGFTLVELLTVIVIILILAGLTFQVMAIVNRRMARSRAVGDLERLKNALTEFYAVYGCYPPVSGATRVFVWPNSYPAVPDGGMQLGDGLATYLCPQSRESLDRPDDVENSKRWQKYMAGWPDGDSTGCVGSKAGFGEGFRWTNNIHTFHDPWERPYVYSSVEPYQAFVLYSLGPDGRANTVDDIGNSWAE